MHNCLVRSVPEIHNASYWEIKRVTNNNNTGDLKDWNRALEQQPHGLKEIADRTSVSISTSQQHASTSLGQICLDYCSCYHTETEVTDHICSLPSHSSHTDTRSTSPSTDPTIPGTWQGGYKSTNFSVTAVT